MNNQIKLLGAITTSNGKIHQWSYVVCTGGGIADNMCERLQKSSKSFSFRGR